MKSMVNSKFRRTPSFLSASEEWAMRSWRTTHRSTEKVFPLCPRTMRHLQEWQNLPRHELRCTKRSRLPPVLMAWDTPSHQNKGISFSRSFRNLYGTLRKTRNPLENAGRNDLHIRAQDESRNQTLVLIQHFVNKTTSKNRNKTLTKHTSDLNCNSELKPEKNIFRKTWPRLPRAARKGRSSVN